MHRFGHRLSTKIVPHLCFLFVFVRKKKTVNVSAFLPPDDILYDGTEAFLVASSKRVGFVSASATSHSFRIFPPVACFAVVIRSERLLYISTGAAVRR